MTRPLHDVPPDLGSNAPAHHAARAFPFLLAALLCCGAPPGQAPTASPELPALGDAAPVPDGAPQQLQLVTRERLREHAYWLADDARAGRFTGSAGQQATADYVAERFRDLGLEPLGDRGSYLQYYPVEQLRLEPGSGLLIGDLSVEEVAVLPATGTRRLSVSGRLQWCGAGRPDEIPGALKGRIPVVVLDDAPRGRGPAADLQAFQRYVDLARLLARGDAKAGLILLVGEAAAYGNNLNYTAVLPDHPISEVSGQSRGKTVSVPLMIAGGEAARAVLEAMGVTVDAQGQVSAPEDLPKVSGKMTIKLKEVRRGRACNVAAVLHGSGRKAEAVVFSAHHDHLGRRVDGDSFNGADDNASGTAGLLTIAEAFARGGEPPDRSIVFLSVSGEELGLWGSEYWCDNPTWPLDRVVADINIDMIGRAAADGEGTTIEVTPSKDHAKYSTLGRTAAGFAGRLGISFTSGDRYYERSDHYNFAKKGIPVVFFCDGEHPDYHQVTDEADRLDYPRMEAVTRLAFWTGWEVATAKERPQELGRQSDW